MKINTISVRAKPICTLAIRVKALLRVLSATRREPSIRMSNLVLLLWVENQGRVGDFTAAVDAAPAEIAEIPAKERRVSLVLPRARADSCLAARPWLGRLFPTQLWRPRLTRPFADGPSA